MKIVKKHGFICLLLIVVSVAVYGQVVHHGFINFDDQDYVTENPNVQKGLTCESIGWAFSLHDNDLTYWHPLAYMAHMLDYELFGLKSGYHHASNVLIHIINALLLYALLFNVTGAFYRSAFTAILFAIHPIGVDSVAWISQKKTLLATTFWLLSFIAYTAYSRKGDVKKYAMACVAVMLGLMTKPILVTIPFVFLIWDIWPLNRWEKVNISYEDHQFRPFKRFSLKWLVCEKMPFFMFVVLWGMTPLISEHVKAKNISLDVIPMGLRLKNALVSYFSYIKNYLWPTELSFLYPYPNDVSLIKAMVSGLILAFLTWIILKYIKKTPFSALGWMLFLVVLVPFLGFVQGAVWPAYADRFAYVPFIGLYMITVWGGYDVLRHYGIKPMVYVPPMLIWFSFLIVLSYKQTGYWIDNIRLYTHAINVTDRNYLAYNNLGTALDEKGFHDEARKQYYLSLWAKPGFSKAHYNLAINYLKQGNIHDANEQFTLSLATHPHNPQAKYNLGSIAMAEGSFEEAEAFFRSAIGDDPDFSDAYNNLGVLYLKRGRKLEAAKQFKEAISHNPSNIEALSNLGNSFFDMNRPSDAVICFLRVLNLDSGNIKAMNDLAVIYASMGKLTESESLFTTILKLEPGNTSATNNLALIRSEKQTLQDEYDDVRLETQANPDNMDLQIHLARLSRLLNKIDESEAIYLNILSRKSTHVEAITELARLYENRGEYAKAKLYYTKLVDIDPSKKASSYYSIACMFALEGDSDRAVSWLQKAADAGFNDWEILNSDSRLNAVRTSPLFTEFTKIAGIK